jgi:hypothetical protein
MKDFMKRVVRAVTLLYKGPFRNLFAIVTGILLLTGYTQLCPDD